MEEITTVGIDLAKTIFQIHAVDAAGRVIVQKALKRRDLSTLFSRLRPCLIGIEACVLIPA
jgi:transposase